MHGMLSPRVTDQTLFFLNGRHLSKGFGTLIASFPKLGLNMTQIRADKILSAKALKSLTNKLYEVSSQKRSTSRKNFHVEPWG